MAITSPNHRQLLHKTIKQQKTRSRTTNHLIIEGEVMTGGVVISQQDLTTCRWICTGLHTFQHILLVLTIWRPLLPYGYKASCTRPGWAVICNFWHPGTLTLSGRVPGCQKNYKWRLNLVWHRMLYSCTHLATEGVKGLVSPPSFTQEMLVDQLWRRQFDQSWWTLNRLFLLN